jgi:hypothetical protein
VIARPEVGTNLSRNCECPGFLKSESHLAVWDGSLKKTPDPFVSMQVVTPDFVNMTLSSNVLAASAIAQQALLTSEMLKRIQEQNTQLQRLLIKLGTQKRGHSE